MPRTQASRRISTRIQSFTVAEAAPRAAVPATRYLRSRDLPRLFPMCPQEITTQNCNDHLGLLAKLRRALRSERQRGLGGHWAYDLARHAHLLRAYRAEMAAYLVARGLDVRALDQADIWNRGWTGGATKGGTRHR
jgi:hypothetical protein